MLQPIPSFQVPIRVLSSAAQAISLNEGELHRLLQDSGLNTEDLYPGNQQTIPGDLFLKLSERLSQLRQSPTTHLEIGPNTQLSVMWPLNEYFLNAPDLYSALSAPPEFQALRLPFLRSRLSLEEHYLKIELQIFIDVDSSRLRNFSEIYFQVIQSLAQQYIGSDLANCYFEFAYPEPEYSEEYQHFFDGQCQFNAANNCYYVPIEYARSTNPRANADTYELARQICQQQLKQVPNQSLTMADRVCRTLLSQPLGKMHEEAVARALFVSKRTLARRLNDEGRNFRQIRDDLLAELSSRQLRESQASIESIAILVGYSDVANFRRAFRRWFHKSPSEYRNSFQQKTIVQGLK